MRPGSSALVRAAPIRTAPVRGMAGLTMPDDWRLTPDESDGDLTARDFAGSLITVRKSRLFSMTEDQVKADETLGAYFLDAWKARRNALLDRGDPAWMKQPSIRPEDPGMVEFAGRGTPRRGFVLGQCPEVDAMGWPIVPDGIQRSICVLTHVGIGLLGLAAVVGVVWALNQAGNLGGD